MKDSRPKFDDCVEMMRKSFEVKRLHAKNVVSPFNTVYEWHNATGMPIVLLLQGKYELSNHCIAIY